MDISSVDFFVKQSTDYLYYDLYLTADPLSFLSNLSLLLGFSRGSSEVLNVNYFLTKTFLINLSIYVLLFSISFITVRQTFADNLFVGSASSIYYIRTNN